MRGDLPDFRDWSFAAVALMRGVVYSEESHLWSLVLSNVSTLETYVARVGLRLVVDEGEGMAYLRQMQESEAADDYARLPKLFRSFALTYGQTLLCVLLREELRRFEEEELRNERCVVEERKVLAEWSHFFANQDDVTLWKELVRCFRRLEELRFVQRFSDDPASWEVRRILKARIPAAELEALRERLALAAAANSQLNQRSDAGLEH